VIVMGTGRRPPALFGREPHLPPPATEEELAAAWERIRAAEAEAAKGGDHEDPVTETP
jgi:hypothetical protein